MITTRTDDFLYCYACGPIDHFFGSFTEAELVTKMAADAIGSKDILTATRPARQIASDCASLAELRLRAEEAFKVIGWEGDHRSGNGTPAYFFVPDPQNFGLIPGYLAKQDNNGDTFIASPVPLAHLDGGCFARCTYKGGNLVCRWSET